MGYGNWILCVSLVGTDSLEVFSFCFISKKNINKVFLSPKQDNIAVKYYSFLLMFCLKLEKLYDKTWKWVDAIIILALNVKPTKGHWWYEA